MQPGEKARNKYNPVKYSFVPICAGEQHILTSDPWSFLGSQLQARLPAKKGTNRANIERAFHYARLAEDFYRAAEITALPAKGTLVYYGMLNLVKCYLSGNKVELEKSYEHHGLQLPLGKKRKILIKKPNDASGISIFSRFATHLGVPVMSDREIDLEDALAQVPEIHGIYSSTTNEKGKLLPVEIDFLVNAARNRMFTEVSYKKEQEYKVDCTKFLKGPRGTYFQEGYPQTGMVVYRSKSRREFDKDNISRKYKNILADYQAFDIVPILTRQGYRYYVDLKPGGYPTLCYSLAAMFYLGSAARYRPVEMESVLSGTLRPVISELLSVSPKQFLYQMVSHITGKECVIPYSAL